MEIKDEKINRIKAKLPLLNARRGVENRSEIQRCLSLFRLRSIERESDRMCRVAVPYFLRIRSTAGESEKSRRSISMWWSAQHSTDAAELFHVEVSPQSNGVGSWWSKTISVACWAFYLGLSKNKVQSQMLDGRQNKWVRRVDPEKGTKPCSNGSPATAWRLGVPSKGLPTQIQKE
nr:hypothetical protein Iba_chr11cCG8270 [Ipomoea batatas]